MPRHGPIPVRREEVLCRSNKSLMHEIAVVASTLQVRENPLLAMGRLQMVATAATLASNRERP